MVIELYCLCYLLVILVIDWTSFFDEVPVIKKFCVKHPVLSHPLRCSLCATWWMSVVFVLMTDITLWVLLLPWLSSLVSILIGKLFDLINRI